MGKTTEATLLQEKEKRLADFEAGGADSQKKEEDETEMTLKSKYITTAVIYYCNIVLGICATFLAPALIDFRDKFETDTLTISLVFTISMICALVSAIAFGVIFNYINRHALITFLLALMGIIIIILPFSPNLTLFFVLNALATICTGGYLTAQIVWIIEIWQGKGPYIQGQHFFFSLGCIFPPLIFAPFLSNKNDDMLHSSSSNHGNQNDSAVMMATTNSPIVTISTADDNGFARDLNATKYFFVPTIDDASISASGSGGYRKSQVIVPCAIVGVITLIGALLLLLIFCCLPKPAVKRSKSKNSLHDPAHSKKIPIKTADHDGYTAVSYSKEENISINNSPPPDVATLDLENEDENVGQNSKNNLEQPSPSAQPKRTLLKIFLIIISAAMVGSYSSMESSTGHFLQVFALYTPVAFSQAEGAKLLFGYNMAYTAGRLGGILITSFNSVRPQFLLVANFALTALGNFVLLVWGGDIVLFMWIGSILIGVGCSTGVPSVFAYVQNHLEITNVIGSILMVSGGSLAAVYPIIVGKYIEGLPGILMYTNFFSIAIGIVAFIVFVVTVKRNKRGGGKL